jgi:AAA+ ATPase superfamily predicted ATPase
MSEREPIILLNGDELEHVEDTYHTYLNKSIFIYGPSKTGKTVTVKHILNKLKQFIPIVLLVCPSEMSNNNYKDIVPRAAVFSDINLLFLKDLFARQEASAQIFEKTNNISVLESLYLKCPHSRVDTLLLKLEEKYDKAINRAKEIQNDAVMESELNQIKEKYDDARKVLYRKQIGVNASKINGRLTDDEKLTLKYINFNPNILLIFDDYAAGLKKFGNSEIMKSYMYRGRHNKITLMIVNHDSTDLPPPIRSNAFVIIFGSAEMATKYFAKSSGNGFTNEQSKEIKKIVDIVYKEKEKSPEKYRKFVWIREGAAKNYYYFLADITKTEMFGSDAFWELCSRGEKDQNSLDTSNPFISKFL